MTPDPQAHRDQATVRYRVTGMDCSTCATNLGKVARSVSGIYDVRVSIASLVMTLRTVHSSNALPQVEQVVTALGYQLDRLDSREANADDNNLSKDGAHTSPTYRRALWIVVLLNVGYGLIEIVSGFVSDSQALKADALDFLSDGLITGLGLVAITCGPIWRARSALMQGLFQERV